MARLKKLSRKRIEAQNHSGKQRIKRQPEVREAEIAEVHARRLDNKWDTWTPDEAYRELMKTCGGATPDYVSGLPRFIQECKRMYPGETFGQLKDRIAHEYQQVYSSY